MTPAGETSCLRTIAEDEAHVIKRCLAAERPIVDHWIVVDNEQVGDACLGGIGTPRERHSRLSATTSVLRSLFAEPAPWANAGDAP